MNHVYFSVILTASQTHHSEWHPRPGDSIAILSRGAFRTQIEAHEWAKTRLPMGASYAIRQYFPNLPPVDVYTS